MFCGQKYLAKDLDESKELVSVQCSGIYSKGTSVFDCTEFFKSQKYLNYHWCHGCSEVIFGQTFLLHHLCWAIIADPCNPKKNFIPLQLRGPLWSKIIYDTFLSWRNANSFLFLKTPIICSNGSQEQEPYSKHHNPDALCSEIPKSWLSNVANLRLGQLKIVIKLPELVPIATKKHNSCF